MREGRAQTRHECEWLEVQGPRSTKKDNRRGVKPLLQYK